MNLSHIQRKLNVGYPEASRIKKVVDYIENVGECKVEWFDEDHEPIGPELRKKMTKAGAIFEQGGFLSVAI